MYVNPKKLNKTKVQSLPQEDRLKIKFFLKEFNNHEKLKPVYDIKEDDPDKIFENQMALQRWAMKYGLLIKKLDELGYEFKKPTEGTAKQSLEEGRSARAKLIADGKKEE